MNDIEQRIKVTAAKQGLLLGLVIVALSILYFYFVTAIAKSAILLAAGPVFFYLFVPVFLIVFLCFRLRGKIGGYWTFKQATTGIFIMFLASYFIYLAGMNLVFYKFIEPDYVHKTEVAAISARTKFMKEKGAKQQEIDKELSKMNKEIRNQQNTTFGGTITSIVIYTIFIFIFSLLFAALFKKDPPAYVQQG